MSDKTKIIGDTFLKSGLFGKYLISIIIIVVIFLSFNIWTNLQNQSSLTQIIRLNNNIENMVRNQESIGVLKEKIKSTYDSAFNYFNDDVLQNFGKILSDNNITFPQELNIILQKYRGKLSLIKDCLIMP